ncbi:MULTISPECIES: hypothetical protein [unclassified Leifsonia]|uniref:hypothetical protein n=1 Tax=unclassified Leifsonia TaxID=2663824 RepID=UPI00037C0C88|nr:MULTISPECIES: hypothetical protein [unclassified Leifsonia]TDP99602.1 hypothetical protein AXZ95_3524 [Leifsonia sp. 115AMFTsu3.1]
MKRRLVALPLAAVLLLGAAPALTACSFQGVVKDVSGGNVDLGGKSVPADFPKEVPLADGEVVFGAGLGSGADKVWNVTVKVENGDAYTAIEKQLTDAGFTGQFGTRGPNGGGTGTFSNGTYGVLVVVTDAGSNGWVANYSVSKGGTPSPTPSAG